MCNNTDSTYNYFENRIRVDFRGYGLMMMISNRTGSVEFMEELKHFFYTYGNPVIDKYEKIRLAVENYFHSVKYWDSIKYLTTINEKNIPNDKKTVINY